MCSTKTKKIFQIHTQHKPNKKNIRSIGILSENEAYVVSAFKNKFPELKSYKLKSLCEHFNIELKNHHRAYDDAKATFELFKILNE